MIFHIYVFIKRRIHEKLFDVFIKLKKNVGQLFKHWIWNIEKDFCFFFLVINKKNILIDWLTMFKGMVGGGKWFGDVLPSPVLESRGSVTGVFTRMAFTGRNVTAPRMHAIKHPAWCPSLRSFSWRAVPWLHYFILIEEIFQDIQIFKKQQCRNINRQRPIMEAFLLKTRIV